MSRRVGVFSFGFKVRGDNQAPTSEKRLCLPSLKDAITLDEFLPEVGFSFFISIFNLAGSFGVAAIPNLNLLNFVTVIF